MSESYGEVDENEIKMREDKNSCEWEDDSEEICLKRMKISEEKPTKKRLEKPTEPVITAPAATNVPVSSSTTQTSQSVPSGLSIRIPIEKTTQAISDITLLQESMTTEELRKCKEINRKMMNQPESPAFNVPVDPVALQVPTYFTVIKHPMDLGTIKRNLMDKKYITKEEFQADMLLVFDNALKFNHPESEVYHWAVKLKKQFETFWKTSFKDKKVVETKISSTPHADALVKPEEKKPESVKKRSTSSRKKNNNKSLTKEEMKKLKEDIKQVEKNKEKLTEVLAVVNVDSKGKNEVSLDLTKYSVQQLREIQRILKGKGRKDEEYENKSRDEKIKQSIQELEQLTKNQRTTTLVKKQTVNKRKKEDSDSDSELSSSSSVDSEEVNLMRMNKTN